jgi:hypothetical protein
MKNESTPISWSVVGYLRRTLRNAIAPRRQITERGGNFKENRLPDQKELPEAMSSGEADQRDQAQEPSRQTEY